MPSIPSERFNNNNWLKIHHNQCFHVNHNNIDNIIGNSSVAGLTCYNKTTKNLFANRFIKLGTHGDSAENVI